MTPRRELPLALALCLAGSAVTLVGVGRTWLTYSTTSGTIDPVDEVLTGAQVSGVTRALALVGLASVLALIATRSWTRAVVGGLVLLAGLGIVVSAVGALTGPASELLPSSVGCEDQVGTPVDRGGVVVRGCYTPLQGIPGSPAETARLSTTGPILSLVGGGLLVVAGSLVAVRGRRWAALGASYEPPTRATPSAPATDKQVWDALDRGDDPTA